MDFYVIPPIAHSDLMSKGDRIFVLAQLYKKSTEYKEAVLDYKRKGYWITLDNGAGDHDPLTSQELLKVALDLIPNEIIPVDVLYNKEQTLKNLIDFIETIPQELKEVEILACPQGKDQKEWLDCYSQMLELEEVTTLGFSKLAIPQAFNTGSGDQGIMEGRHKAFELIKSLGLLKKPIHCLGAGDPREFLKYKNEPLMRSTDSCFSIWAGMCGISWRNGNFTRVKTPLNYFELKMTSSEMTQALDNIDFLKVEIFKK